MHSMKVSLPRAVNAARGQAPIFNVSLSDFPNCASIELVSSIKSHCETARGSSSSSSCSRALAFALAQVSARGSLQQQQHYAPFENTLIEP
eukprot:15135-Heterococcus_DN1.PRE.1